MSGGGDDHALIFLFVAVVYRERDDVIWVKVIWLILLVSQSSLVSLVYSVSSTDRLIPTDDEFLGFVIFSRAINDADTGMGHF